MNGARGICFRLLQLINEHVHNYAQGRGCGGMLCQENFSKLGTYSEIASEVMFEQPHL